MKQLEKINDTTVREFEEIIIPEQIIPEERRVEEIFYTLKDLDEEIAAIDIQIAQHAAEEAEEKKIKEEYIVRKDNRMAKRDELLALGIIPEVDKVVEQIIPEERRIEEIFYTLKDLDEEIAAIDIQIAQHAAE